MRIKKRSIIAGIITLGILYLCFSFWNKHFELFIIISVLSYLLSFKLVDYLADFKTIKDKSRIDVIFLTIFFILLFVPMLKIDNVSTFSKQEGRSLAKYKPLIKKGHKINYNYGKDFDNWFNDRFFLRNIITGIYSDFKYKLAYNYYENTKGYINKRNNWISEEYVSKTDKDKKLTIYNINKLKEFCDKHNIKFYIMIVPQKEDIYAKELYPVIRNSQNYKENNELIRYIKENTGIEIVYPHNELKQLRKTGFSYFKTDAHWTDEGAYLGYLRLMEKVKKDFPNIKIAKENDFHYIYKRKVRVLPRAGFHNGRTYSIMKLQEKSVFDTKYKYFISNDFDYNKRDEILKDSDLYEIYIFNNDTDAPNAVLFGDSFTLNLLPILPASFKNTTNIYSWVPEKKDIYSAFKISRFEEYILKNNPQVLVITLSDRHRLNYLFDKE